jgi:hypothetical protein
MRKECKGVGWTDEKLYSRMTNYSHSSGGLLYRSASLRLEDEILMYVGRLLVSVSVLRRGDPDAHCMGYRQFDSTIVVFRLTP